MRRRIEEERIRWHAPSPRSPPLQTRPAGRRIHSQRCFPATTSDRSSFSLSLPFVFPLPSASCSQTTDKNLPPFQLSDSTSGCRHAWQKFSSRVPRRLSIEDRRRRERGTWALVVGTVVACHEGCFFLAYRPRPPVIPRLQAGQAHLSERRRRRYGRIH